MGLLGSKTVLRFRDKSLVFQRGYKQNYSNSVYDLIANKPVERSPIRVMKISRHFWLVNSFCGTFSKVMTYVW